MKNYRGSRAKTATLRGALQAARAQLDRAETALDRREAELALMMRLALARAEGASWPDCAELLGLPRTRHGSEAARQRFMRAAKKGKR
jgi:hypothetical protein